MDLRTDGRKWFTYRPIYIETGVIAQASGSARVKMGATEVIASVKAELGRPNSFQPDKGRALYLLTAAQQPSPHLRFVLFLVRTTFMWDALMSGSG